MIKTLTAGHKYELPLFEDPTQSATIQFIEKAPNEKGEFKTVNDGITNEQLLEVLIDRLGVLDNKFPSKYNQGAIRACTAALKHLNNRTAERQSRGVEGKHVK